MFEDYRICPYTGLRPFSEDESIYFKGRDEHIEQATRQLEKNKFIMLTGASGDGKSSLVYAGIIPNAKAGFLKASFSNWAVVDFRPERSPLVNLSRSLAAQLNISADTVATELKYGFSALVDIYKASPLYYDTRSEDWTEADNKSKNERRRKAANLIILADQFEEFFTNPENFEKGVPSQEAMSVTNLLLETARIALEENLPIYVVVTMRSDFIGQCAAFRGLPEYIGFSQFFVPRLNRKELREVIEEPAVLSGNIIERRLTERLIHDIVEGTDQLPILQHALNQIWKMADEGQASMDLIHYAMVGGMRGSELPNEDAAKFNAWFEKLPANVQACYVDPDLQNVLNTHANKLYNLDSDHLKQTHKADVSDDDAKMIIKTAFKCLTKINNSRAVRNRMSLEEITAIINVPHLDYKIVGQVLDIFREPGNTLLRPFSDDKPKLSPNDVLDITHESLIRNWENLEQWAKEEFNSYTISRDFEQQLGRWLESKRSNDFLLYIGPLTYFEAWIKNEKPNAAWAARYLEGDQSTATKLAKANEIQKDSLEFLRKSARKHLVTRTVVRYGAGRIAAVLAILALITLSSFVVKNYIQRQRSYVMKQVKATVLKNAGNNKVTLTFRASAITEALMSGEVTIPEIVSRVKDPFEKINLSTGISTQLVYQGTREPKKEILQALSMSDSLIHAFPISFKVGTEVSRMIKEINDQSDVIQLAYFYNPDIKIDTLRARNAKRSAKYVLNIVRTEATDFDNISDFDRALEFALNYHGLSNSEIDELIEKLSPFNGHKQTAWIADRFERNKLVQKGFYDVAFNFSGLYQELAYLFAAKGNSQLALKCLDSLLFYNQNYFQNDYSVSPDNATHIAGTFSNYGNELQLDEFVDGYCQKTKTSVPEFYRHLLARSKTYEYGTAPLENDQQYDADMNLLLEFSSDTQLDFFFNKYREVLSTKESNPKERDFQLALSYKDEGILRSRKMEVQGLDSLKVKYVPLYDKAMEYFRKIDTEYLNERIPIVEISSNDNLFLPRKFLFIYPDIRTSFHPNEPRLYHFFFTSSAFLEYILSHNLFSELYVTDSDLSIFERYFRDYHFVEIDVIYTASKRMSYKVLAEIEKALAAANASKVANLDFLYLYLGHEASLHDEGDRVLYYYKHLTHDRTKALFFNSFNPSFALSVVGNAISDLAKFDHFSEAHRIISFFQLPVNRSALYAYGAQGLLLDHITGDKVDQLIDSAFIEMAKVKNHNTGQSNRVVLAYALALRNNAGDIDKANRVIKNVVVKFAGLAFMGRAYVWNGRAFDAYRYIKTDEFSDQTVSDFTFNIYHGNNDASPEVMGDHQWDIYRSNRTWIFDRPILYVDEVS